MAWRTNTGQQTTPQKRPYTPKNTTNKKETTMAGQKTKTKNRNANVRSKLSPCKNSKHKTQWPEASTQANQQHRETKTLQVLTAQKTPLTKIKHDGRTKKPQKITRTRARAQNIIRVKIENAKHHGLKHGHMAKKRRLEKNKKQLTPQKNITEKENNM